MFSAEQCLLTIVVFATGCTSWSRLPESRPVPDRGTVQVWTGTQDTLLRDAKTVGDSLVGRQPLPDTMRLALPLATIDSLRIQTTDMGKTFIVGTGVAIAVLLAYAEGFKGLSQ
jgi:hypothetical protein